MNHAEMIENQLSGLIDQLEHLITENLQSADQSAMNRGTLHAELVEIMHQARQMQHMLADEVPL